MSQLGDFISVEKGLHPSGRFRESFFVPTPPSDADLTLFSSAASYSHPSASPLPPWLEDLAGLKLRGAIPTVSVLRGVQRDQENINKNSTFVSSPATSGARPLTSLPAGSRPTPSPPAAADLAADAAVTVDGGGAAAGDRDDSPRGTSPAPDSSDPLTPGAVPGSTAAPDLAPIAPPRGPNQLVCRGIKTVDEVIMAWETGLFGYGPMKNYKGGCGGKLDKAQVKLLSKAFTVYKKVGEMGREEFRRVYEAPVNGKSPTLCHIRTTIEKETPCKARGRKRNRVAEDKQRA